MKAPPSFSMLFSIGPAQEALLSTLTRVELLLRVRTLSTECRDWVDAELLHAGIISRIGRLYRIFLDTPLAALTVGLR